MSNGENEVFPCFYNIPGYSNYVISKEGLVYNRTRNELLKGSRNPDGYVNFRITDSEGYTLTWGRHRLLAFVFKHPGPNVNNLIVNHLNGVKGDDRLDNLEWVTYRGNAEHAGYMGLTTKCIPISVRDVATGIVVDYASIVECARVFGVSKDFISWRVRAGSSRVFPEGKQYRYSHSNEPWGEPRSTSIESLQGGSAKAVLVRNVLTGNVQEFKMMSQLASHLKLSPSTITKWMKQADQTIFPGFIQLKWADDETPWKVVDDPYLELEKYTDERTVKTINEQTKEMKVFTSATECAKEMNISPTALNYRLTSNGGKVFSDGFRYSYYSCQYNSCQPTVLLFSDEY